MMDRCDQLAALAALLAGCGMPPMFSVAVDEPIIDGLITLNGGSAKLIKNLDGAYWAKWREKAAEGELMVVFTDGKRASCKIEYAPGNSPQRQAFAIRNRKCARLPDR
jgi:hypothetical protein